MKDVYDSVVKGTPENLISGKAVLCFRHQKVVIRRLQKTINLFCNLKLQ